MSDSTRAIMQDMLSELSARNTAGVWKFGDNRDDKANICINGRSAVCIRIDEKFLSLMFPAHVIEHLLDTDDGTVSPNQHMPMRWIRVSPTSRLTIQRHPHGHWIHTVAPAKYNNRKDNLLKLVALALAEMLDTFACGRLLLELRNK